MTSNLVLLTYCLLIMAASVGGGLFPALVRLTHTRMQLMMSFVAGLMLGVALLHMLPHAAQQLPSLDWVMEGALLGLLMMFFLIRIFHFHQHHTGDEATDAPGDHACNHDHGHDHGHSHGGHHGHTHSGNIVMLESLSPPAERQEISWIGLAFGLSIHTLIDGMALAASVVADSSGTNGIGLFGAGTFLAVLLHKPLDAMSITTLMEAQGWARSRQRLMNVLFALMFPLGAILFLIGAKFYFSAHHEVLGLALAFSAGVFLCISLGDLLPEVHFHTHDRGKLSFMLLLGVALAYGVGFLEPKPKQDSLPPAHQARP